MRDATSDPAVSSGSTVPKAPTASAATDLAPIVAADTGACHNCGAELHGHFCAQCGQEALPLNPRLTDVFHEFARELLDMDGRVFRSVRKLFLAPGFLTREQFEGRRAPWLSPVRLYLIFSVAYFALMSIGGPGLDVRIDVSNPDEVQGLRERGFQSEAEVRQAVSDGLATWMPRVMFVLVPLFAALVHLARRRSGYTYPQHLLFALHAHAAWFGAGAVIALIGFALPGSMGDEAGRSILVVAWGIYLVKAFRAAYGGTTRRAILHTHFVMVTYGIAIVLASVAIVLPIVLGRQPLDAAKPAADPPAAVEPRVAR
jgi:hypothetical protein